MRVASASGGMPSEAAITTVRAISTASAVSSAAAEITRLNMLPRSSPPVQPGGSAALVINEQTHKNTAELPQAGFLRKSHPKG